MTGLVPLGSDCPETLDTGRLQGSLGLFCSGPQGEFVANNLSVMAIDDSRQVAPPIATARDVRDVGSPALVTTFGSADAALYTWAWRDVALVDKPALSLEYPVHRLAIDRAAVSEAQNGPDATIAESRVFQHHTADVLG